MVKRKIKSIYVKSKIASIIPPLPSTKNEKRVQNKQSYPKGCAEFDLDDISHIKIIKGLNSLICTFHSREKRGLEMQND